MDAVLYLLQKIAGNNMTPNQLSVASIGFRGVADGRKPDIALYLLNAILAAGGGGGASQLVSYTNNPNTEALTPPNPLIAALAISPNKPIYTWTTPAGPWV
jgi:hypothetical protein